MSSLTGQQINQSYQGLLKLADSSTGITQNLQSLQDGLGNDTGLRIAQNNFVAPTVLGNYTTNPSSYKPDYVGTGFAVVNITNFNNAQNNTFYSYFYDTGVYSYSALTYNLNVLTSTSDVVEASFYTLQFVDGYGAVPKDLIMSGITLESSTTTGVKETALPSILSFSGLGSGFYGIILHITNASVNPTVRYRGGLPISDVQSASYGLGYVLNAAGDALNVGNRNATFQSTGYLLNGAPLSTYTSSDIITLNNTNVVAGGRLGFGLKVIK